MARLKSTTNQLRVVAEKSPEDTILVRSDGGGTARNSSNSPELWRITSSGTRGIRALSNVRAFEEGVIRSSAARICRCERVRCGGRPERRAPTEEPLSSRGPFIPGGRLFLRE